MRKCEICYEEATTIDVIETVVRYYCKDCKRTINLAKKILGGNNNGSSKT